MGKQWRNPPVYFVIAQVRFNPVLNISPYVASIQEDFRRAEFPDFNKALNVAFNVGMLAGLIPNAEMPMQRTERYLFGNAEGTELFILDPNALTYQTTEYKTFDVLVKTFLSRFDCLTETLSLSFSDRVGLRYLDAVMPGPDETLEAYLIPQVFGIRGKIKGEFQHSFTESLVSLPEGKLLSRVVIQTGPIGFPPDLQLNAPAMKLNPRFVDHKGLYAIVDTDGFHEGRDRVDRSTIENKFDELHRHVDLAFKSIITRHAVNAWS